MGVDLIQLAQDANDPVTFGGYTIPWNIYEVIAAHAVGAGHVDDPFEAGDSCWKLAFYFGIAAVESASTFDMAIEGDPALNSVSGPAWTCCVYYICLADIDCGEDGTAWDVARAHAPYDTDGAYLSHGIYQLYVCGQGAGHICTPSLLHDLGIHMGIALPPISGAIDTYWDDNDVEQSVRTCAQASGHPGWVGDFDFRITNIWNATQAIQPELCTFLEGGGLPSPNGPPPPPGDWEPWPLPPLPISPQTLGPWPLPPLPSDDSPNPLPTKS